MIYSTLIRRLVIASIEARYGHYDIADRLADRCLPETSIIRKTLMNAVCDPRFKLHVNQVRGWKKIATAGLENLAELLLSMENLTQDLAEEVLDQFLTEWMLRMLDISNDENRSEVKMDIFNPHKGKSVEDATEEDIPAVHYEPDEGADPTAEITEALNSFGDLDPRPKESEEEKDLETTPIGPSLYQEGKKSPFPAQAQEGLTPMDKDDETPEEEKTGSSDNADCEMNSPEHHQGVGEHEAESAVALENRFLSHIPPSLVKLAKLIGRSGEDDSVPSGHFQSATKSDIAGVSTGNDLSSVLPSELALLADPRTDSLFFKNYVTKKLQVFSSVSRGHKGKKKQDGPIIICLDTSSSMAGEPMLVAKALTIAVCIIAQRRHRKVLVIKYSETHHMYSLQNLATQRKDFMKFLSIVTSGGNNENDLFHWLVSDVIPNEGDYKTADILCVSDFGWGMIEDNTAEKIMEEKKNGLRIYGLNIGYNEYGSLTEYYKNMGFVAPEDICDSLWSYSRGVCKEEMKPSRKKQFQVIKP